MNLKRVKIGPISLMIFVEDPIAERIRSSILHRYLIRPVRNRLGRLNKPMNNQKEIRLLDGNPSTDRGGAEFIQTTPEQKEILQKIAGFEWYHSIHLGYDVVTPGFFNHQPYLAEYCLPESLEGMRVLDVATLDGFWAFEFEKRGAAEVIAMDIESFNDLDLPPLVRGRIPSDDLHRKTEIGFNIAKEILGSNVQRKVRSVYDLSHEWMGKFDMAFCSDLLIHLMNPMKALGNIRKVVSSCAFIVEPFDPDLDLVSQNISQDKGIMRYRGGSDKCTWWEFSLRSLENMIRGAGFNSVELVNRFVLVSRGKEVSLWHAVFKAYP